METNTSGASVIVPVLNAARFVREALESVDAQTHAPLEIVVVDGPSTDDTPEIVRSFPRVRYMHQTGTGMWNALNEGIAAARGEFVAMISADDLWMPDKLERQVTYLRAHPECSHVFGLTRFVVIDGETAPPSFRAELFEGARLAILLENLLAYKSFFERVGPFDESMQITSDVDWFARMANLNEPRGLIEQVLLHKRIHGKNLSSDPALGHVFNRELLTAMHAQMQRRRAMSDFHE